MPAISSFLDFIQLLLWQLSTIMVLGVCHIEYKRYHNNARHCLLVTLQLPSWIQQISVSLSEEKTLAWRSLNSLETIVRTLDPR